MLKLVNKDGIITFLNEKDLAYISKFLSLSYFPLYTIEEKKVNEKEINLFYKNDFSNSADQVVYLKLIASEKSKALMLYRIERKNSSYFISFSIRRGDLGMKYLRHSLPLINKYIFELDPKEVLILVGKKDYPLQKLVIKAGFNNDIYNSSDTSFELYSLYGGIR